MAGVMLLIIGIVRFGGVIKFIPDPVIVGFTAGIAVVIFVGQWKDFFGLPPVAAQHFHEKIWQSLVQFYRSCKGDHHDRRILSHSLLSSSAQKFPDCGAYPVRSIALVLATTLQQSFAFRRRRHHRQRPSAAYPRAFRPCTLPT